MSGEPNFNLDRVYRLLREADGPIIELKIRRAVWQAPVGNLAAFSVSAAKQLNRRALDSLFNSDLVAVGVFKVAVSPPSYLIELHQLVAGVEVDDLRRAFAGTRPAAGNKFRTREVKDLKRAISGVLNTELLRQNNRPADRSNDKHSPTQRWRTVNPFADTKPNEEHLREYGEWVRTLTSSTLLFRYGCDRYWNKLAKAHRTLKPRKKHPCPYWLEPFWFGGPFWDLDRHSTKKVGERNPDYLDFDVEDEE